jgi:hypothetical protein
VRASASARVCPHILQMNTSYMGYILTMFTHRSHTCAYASERVIKSSLFYGRILYKFAGHILQMTTRYIIMGYILIMFTHRAHTSARAWLRVRLSMDGFYSNLLGTYYKSPQVAWATYLSCSRISRMRASARMRDRAWL